MTKGSMHIEVLNNLLAAAPEALRHLSFTMLEVGALPLEGQEESFHQLAEIFPGSRIISVEVDEDLCAQLNVKAKKGQEFYPAALGRTQETRQFYLTRESMCCSLYPPNEALISRYYNMEPAMLESVTTTDTVSLDYFAGQHRIEDIDFIKIDIQGAELDVFMGGTNALRNVAAIVTEVEFVPHYVQQPLFGDVCAFLMSQGFMFHKFLGMASRALMPVVMNKNKSTGSQHMWSDAMFIRDIMRLEGLPADKLLKLGILSLIYDSPDVAFTCFHAADQKGGTDIGMKFLQAGRLTGTSKPARRRWPAIFRR